MKAIINGKIVLKDGVVENRALLYTDKIEGLVFPDKIPDGTEIIDAAGGYVTPGLIDIHTHGYVGQDVCAKEIQAVEIMAKALVKNGVTGFLPTTMTESMDTIKNALNNVRALKDKSRDWNGSTILGAHAEGPFISMSKKGAQNPLYVLKPDAGFIKEYADILKIVTLAPEEDEGFAAIREVNRDTDVVLSIGHTSADYETALDSMHNGIKHVTHLFNAMTGLSHRAPGVVTAALNSDASCELIVDKFHVDPSLYNLIYKMKGRKLCFITDCMPAGGLPFGEYTLGGQKIIYRDVVCRLEDGTICGSVLALNKGVQNVYESSDIPLHECVNCASLNPATVIGIDDRKGSLEIGKDADIAIFDNEFNTKMTIIGGTVRYEA